MDAMSHPTLEPKASAGWWEPQGRQFLIAAAASAAIVLLLAWLTGLRQVMHAALLSIAAAALLPFAVIAGGFLLLVLLGLVAALPGALSGGDAGPDHGLSQAGVGLVEGSVWLVPRYYRFLGKRRHPVFWGVPTGILLGGLLLWAALAILVLPGEAGTVELLAATKDRIDETYRETGEFPRPDEGGHLALAAYAGSGKRVTQVVTDSFGRPLLYEVSRSWRKLSAYRLISTGFDGRQGTSDDLCVSGSTRLRELADTAQSLVTLVRDIGSGKASVQDRLEGIRALRCRNQ
jgi:hypothetical protein